MISILVFFWLVCIVAIVFLDLGGDRKANIGESKQAFVNGGVAENTEIFNTINNSGDGRFQEAFTNPEI